MGILQDLTGSSAKRASNAAAADTFNKQTTAVNDLNAYGDTLPGEYNKLAGNFDEYRSAGSGALKRLMSGLGLDGGNGQDFINAYHNIPGYQAGMDAGTNAVAKRFNAGNMGQSGAVMKGLQRFGSDYEDQRSGDYLSRLMGVSNQGEQATGQATGVEAAGLGARTGVRTSAFGGSMNAAGTIGQGMVAGEQAKQTALQNLLSTGAYVAGSAMGAPMKPPTAKSAPNWWQPAPYAN